MSLLRYFGLGLLLFWNEGVHVGLHLNHHGSNIAVLGPNGVPLVLQLHSCVCCAYEKGQYRIRTTARVNKHNRCADKAWSRLSEIATKEWGWQYTVETITSAPQVFDMQLADLYPNNVPTFAITHANAHACHAFWDSPFQSAVLMMLDGGYKGEGSCFVFLAKYNASGFMVFDLLKACELRTVSWRRKGMLGLEPKEEAGRRDMFHACDVLMDYSLLGSAKADLADAAANDDVPKDLESRIKRNPALARDWMATVQSHLEQQVLAELRAVQNVMRDVDGIIMTGGVAFNWLLNTRIRRTFGKPLHVPSDPGDSALSAGMLLCRSAQRSRGPHPFLGPSLASRGKNVPRAWQNASSTAVARLLNLGKPVAVLRGRGVTGHRKLGHASVIAIPSETNYATLTGLKHRKSQWTRLPCLMAEDHLPLVATDPFPSPHLSFVTSFQPQVVQRFPFLSGLFPFQTVDAASDAWLHEVLISLAPQHHVLLAVDLDHPFKYTDSAVPYLRRRRFPGSVVVNTELLEDIYANFSGAP